MPHITYLSDQIPINQRRDTQGIEYSDRLDEIAGRISQKWRRFDGIRHSGGAHSYSYKHLGFYQDPDSHCISIVGAEVISGRKKNIIDIRFSFVERAVLKETLKGLGLPVEKISDNDIGFQ